jgi:hypothetical protein
MKKLTFVAVALTLLSTAALADQNVENANKMDEMRHQFMVMTDQMIDGQLLMLKTNEAALTSYQRVLKQMMQNESSSNNN